MTFLAQETSVESGKPVEIYRFVQGADTFEYTSAAETVTVLGQPYDPESITRTALGSGPEDRDNVLELEFPATNPFVLRYVGIVPGPRAFLTIQAFHRGDAEVLTIFQGLVRSVSFTDDGAKAKVAVLPIQAAMSRPIPRFTFSGLCNHVLYDARCKVDPNSTSFRRDVTVTAVSGNTVTVSGIGGFPNGFFTAGWIEAQGGLDHRLVLGHTGSVLTLLVPFQVSPLGSTVVLRAGCDHTITTCHAKFANVVNYGGFAFIPIVNPFQSGLDVT